MMNRYAARQAYQNSKVAADYDLIRFRSLRGRLGDSLDKRALSIALANLIQYHSDPIRVLDMPCGTGRITRFLLEKGCYVSGADISLEMMQNAMVKVEGFNNFEGFFQCDALNLIFGNDSFDCIVSIRFMGHIPKDIRTGILSEFYRVSRHVIIEYNIRSKIVMFRRNLERNLQIGLPLPKRWSWQTFSKQKVISELKEVGFEIVKMCPKFKNLSDSWYVLAARKNDQL